MTTHLGSWPWFQCLVPQLGYGLLPSTTDEKAPISSNHQRSQSLPCCPCSRYMAKYIRSCPCKQRGARCSSCSPLLLDRCRNCGALDTASLSHPTHNSLLLADGGCPCPDRVDASGQYVDDASVEPQQECGANDIFLCKKFVGTSFVNMLSEEIERCTKGQQRSE